MGGGRCREAHRFSLAQRGRRGSLCMALTGDVTHPFLLPTFAVDPSDVVWAPEAAGTQCLDRAVFIEKLGDKTCAFLRIFQKEFCWVLV